MSSDITSQILKAVEQSNVWELRKIFQNVGIQKKQRYLNEYWIADGPHRGYTFLHLSVHCDVDICKYLLSEGANPNQYNLEDNTPLHIASLQNRGIIIRLLIKYGADPLMKNNENKLCHEICKKSQQQHIKTLIEKCINEQDELKKIKNIPFQNSDNKELKEIISNLSDESIIDDVLEIIAQKMDFEQFEETQQEQNDNEDDNDNDDENENKNENEEEIGINRQDIINGWSSTFSSSGITVLKQLLLPAFEDWPILVNVPSFVIYCLETILTAYCERLMDEIVNFNKSTKVIDVLYVANIKLKNKFDDKLKEFESILIEQGIHSLGELQNITSRTWRIIKIDLVFSDMIRKIINLYNINCESNIATKQNEKDKTKNLKKDQYILLNCNCTVSCITTDHKFIHIATMDGKIKAFEFEIFDSFHEFILLNDENDLKSIHIPLYMQFLNNKHEQLITADKTGNVCCWYLHSNHPNKRAKCIRKWKTHNGYISGFGIPKQSELIFTIGFDGYLRVRNLGFGGKIIHSMQYSNVALTAITFMSKNCVIIGTENGIIMEVDINKQKISNIYKMNEKVPIRSLCLDKENNHCYFSFGIHSIGLLDISNNGEWNFIGKFVEGFDHHQSAVNCIMLRNEYLWSSSEDNSIKIWDLKFLRENIQNIGNKKKGKNTISMPNCIQLADLENLKNDNIENKDIQQNGLLLEVWCSLEIKGMYHNGVQRLYFIENESIMIALAYQQNVIAYDLERIDNILPRKQELITERRQQLNEYEKELKNIQQLAAEANAKKAEKSKKGKKGGKGKKKK